MMAEAKTGNFEGWAVVQKFGHVTHVGFVTTEAYGTAVLFRVDTPELPEREYILESPEYAADGDKGTRWCPVGTKVKRPASPAQTHLIGPGAIYDITPCTEETARRGIENLIRRPLILLELPKEELKALAAGAGATHLPGELLEDGDDDEIEYLNEKEERIGRD